MTATPEQSIPAAGRTLGELGGTTAVDQEVVDGFAAHGHACVRGVLNAQEIAAYRPAIEAAALAHHQSRQPLEERDTYGRAFLQTTNLWLENAGVARFVCSPRLAQLAATLLGVEHVRLYHDQALFKEPDGGHTPWHQDQYYWPIDTDDTITMWMPLVDVSEQSGAMRFVSGSHRLEVDRDLAIGDESHEYFTNRIDSESLPVATHAPLRAGDATFHRGWTVHGAPENNTEGLRSVMTVIYVADGARIPALHRANQRLDLALYLPGLEEGEPAASAFTPVLWPPPEGPIEPPPRDGDYWRPVIEAVGELGAG